MKKGEYESLSDESCDDSQYMKDIKCLIPAPQACLDRAEELRRNQVTLLTDNNEVMSGVPGVDIDVDEDLQEILDVLEDDDPSLSDENAIDDWNKKLMGTDDVRCFEDWINLNFNIEDKDTLKKIEYGVRKKIQDTKSIKKNDLSFLGKLNKANSEDLKRLEEANKIFFKNIEDEEKQNVSNSDSSDIDLGEYMSDSEDDTSKIHIDNALQKQIDEAFDAFINDGFDMYDLGDGDDLKLDATLEGQLFDFDEVQDIADFAGDGMIEYDIHNRKQYNFLSTYKDDDDIKLSFTKSVKKKRLN